MPTARVGLFVTCLVDLMRPRIGFATLKLLEDAGCEVVVPDTQTCCGQPAWNSGDAPGAVALAKKTIAEFEGFDYIVAPSGSCADQIRTEYPGLFADEPNWRDRATALASRTYELTDFLVTVLKVDSVPGDYEGTVTYHDSCTGVRSLGIKEQPRALLAKLKGVSLNEMNGCEECCGFGGTFSVKFGEVSAAIAERKCDNILASGAKAVVAGDLGCLLNIEGKLRRMGDETTQVLHVAEVLAGQDNPPGPLSRKGGDGSSPTGSAPGVRGPLWGGPAAGGA
ncbi:MAG: (Fe-S)-binding protein [Sulfuritalea sp.]|nr:(Fe-S)-binding protein [Sulfuritalea sp.]